MSKPLFVLDDVLGFTGAEAFRAQGFAGEEIFSVVVDSRKAAPGSLFVPLKGERTDGHLYIADAFSRGARVCFVDRSFWDAQGEELRPCAQKFRAACIVVDSSFSALHTLAARRLQSFSALRIGITGSNGKTTTKEITGAILSQEAPSFMTKGNLNSDIGLPLSVFDMEGSPGFAVFEMGINRAGEMDILVDIVRPQAALITNIGSAHSGILGSRRNIAAEKKKLFLALSPDGKAWVYERDTYRAFLVDGVAAETFLFGETSTPGFSGAQDAGLDGWDISLDGEMIRFPLPGIYNLRNALAAVSLCKGVGASGSAIRAGLEAVKPLFGRSEVFRGELTVLRDCYNANPESMGNALAFASSLAWKGRKLAVLGSMKELGSSSAEEHRALGKLLAGSAFDAVFLFGDEMEEAHRACAQARFSGVLAWHTDLDGLRNAVQSFVQRGDLVLVKGSRSMEMERITESLNAQAPGGVHV